MNEEMPKTNDKKELQEYLAKRIEYLITLKRIKRSKAISSAPPAKSSS